MSKKIKGTDICLNGFKFQYNDYVQILNPEDNDYLNVKVMRIIEDTDESLKVEFLVMKTTNKGGYKAGTTFEYEIKKFVDEKDKIRGRVYPAVQTGDELEVPDYMQSSIEEHILDRTVEFLTPFSLRDKGVRERTVIGFLKAQHVIPEDTCDRTAKNLMTRAIKLLPNRFTRGNGWLKLIHTRKTSEATVTPVGNPVSTAKAVDKKMMIEGFVKLVESGLFGGVEWK